MVCGEIVTTSDRVAMVGQWVGFTLRSWLALPATLVHPATTIRFLLVALVGSWPLAVVTGVALGVVVWAHARGVLAHIGSAAVEILPSVLSSAVVLELAPVGAGLIIAARMGASLAAELAAMKQTEQIDALELVGSSPMQVLVAPRVLACTMAAPMLHVFIAGLALFSGYLAELVLGETSWLKYERALLDPLRFLEVLAHGCKTIVFGFLVGVTGCFVGLAAKEGSTGVGLAATRGVVASSVLVIIADVFLVGLIRLAGLT